MQRIEECLNTIHKKILSYETEQERYKQIVGLGHNRFIVVK
jgi:hypothetical protein